MDEGEDTFTYSALINPDAKNVLKNSHCTNISKLLSADLKGV